MKTIMEGGVDGIQLSEGHRSILGVREELK